MRSEAKELPRTTQVTKATNTELSQEERQGDIDLHDSDQEISRRGEMWFTVNELYR